MHDLQRVACVQGGARVLGAGHDFAVPLHGDRALRQAQVLDQGAYGESLGHLARLAVQHDLHEQLHKLWSKRAARQAGPVIAGLAARGGTR